MRRALQRLLVRRKLPVALEDAQRRPCRTKPRAVAALAALIARGPQGRRWGRPKCAPSVATVPRKAAPALAKILYKNLKFLEYYPFQLAGTDDRTIHLIELPARSGAQAEHQQAEAGRNRMRAKVPRSHLNQQRRNAMMTLAACRRATWRGGAPLSAGRRSNPAGCAGYPGGRLVAGPIAARSVPSIRRLEKSLGAIGREWSRTADRSRIASAVHVG
jgi:hypothetical protein